MTIGEKKPHVPELWFFKKEVSGSILLMLALISAVIIANTPLGDLYKHFLHLEISIFAGEFRVSHSLLHWINDGLMTLFFFTIGLEIKREVLVGELASLRMALLPVVAAMGGMLFPGLIYFAFNYGQPGAVGWAIPMATDIAFSLGVIALVGRNLPNGIRVFLTAFAIADDLGAVLIIAFFYTKSISTGYLLGAVICLLILLIGNLMYIRLIPFYIVMGFATWVCMMGSGVHATLAGVAVAMLVPARGKSDIPLFVEKVRQIIDNLHTSRTIDSHWFSIFIRPQYLDAVHSLELTCHDVETPLQRLEHALHPWVVFMILPVFAFFNRGISLYDIPVASALMHPVTLGCLLGLFIGKPLGITLAAFLAVKSGIAVLPEKVDWALVLGAGMLGGIGFTMALFVSGLSFESAQFLNYSKLGVLIGSFLSAAAGSVYLRMYMSRHQSAADKNDMMLESGESV